VFNDVVLGTADEGELDTGIDGFFDRLRVVMGVILEIARVGTNNRGPTQ
jgi:hypothetical protein